MEAPPRVNRRAWNHAEAPCPNCGLHLDAHKDLVEYERPTPDGRATHARIAHRRCGYTGRIELVD